MMQLLLLIFFSTSLPCTVFENLKKSLTAPKKYFQCTAKCKNCQNCFFGAKIQLFSNTVNTSLLHMEVLDESISPPKQAYYSMQAASGLAKQCQNRTIYCTTTLFVIYMTTMSFR